MSKINFTNASTQTINNHKEILEKKGLIGLGRAVSSKSKNASLLALGIISAISIIFAPIAIPLICLYYKNIGKQVVNDERFATIRNQCLFQPSKGELDYFKRLKIFKKDRHIEETDSNIAKINTAHKNYKLAKALTSTDAPLKKYLDNSKISNKDYLKLLDLATSINCPGTKVIKDSSFEQIARFNEIIENNLELDSDATYTFISIITDQGKNFTTISDQEIAEFKTILEAYKTLNDKNLPDILESSTQLLSYVMKIYNAGNPELAKSFAKSFSEHSYMSESVISNPMQFEENFKELILDNSKSLITKEEISEAINAFCKLYNRPENLDKALEENFGKDNVEMVKESLKEKATEVIDGAVDFNHHEMNQSYPEKIMNLVDNISKNLGLSPIVIENYLLQDEITPEIFEKKMQSLKDLSAFAKEKMTLNSDIRNEFTQELFALLGNDLFANFPSSDYKSGLKYFADYASRTCEKMNYSPEDVARGIVRVIKNRGKSKGIDHKAAFDHVAHACDNMSILYPDRRKAIIHELNNEIFVTTYSKNHSEDEIEAIIGDLSKHLKLEETLVRKVITEPGQNILPQEKVQLLIKLSVANEMLINNKSKRVSVVGKFLLAFDPQKIIKITSNNESLEQLRQIVDYSLEKENRKVYPLDVIVKGLSNTLEILSNERGMNENKALEHLYNAAKSRIDFTEDERVKRLLQKEMLKLEVLNQTQETDRESINFAFMLLEPFRSEKTPPQNESLEFISNAVKYCLSLKKEGLSEISIARAFCSNSMIKSYFKIKALDKKSNPKLTEIAKKAIKSEAANLDNESNNVAMGNEKKYFPILVNFLPFIVRELTPKDNKSVNKIVNEELEKIESNFNESETLQLELKEALKNFKIVNSTFTYPIEILKPVIESLFETPKNDIKYAREAILNIESSNASKIEIDEVLNQTQATPFTKNILLLVLEQLSSVHDKHLEIEALKKTKMGVNIVVEGEDAPISEVPNVVHINMIEEILLKLFDEIPDDKSFDVKVLRNLPGMLTGWYGRLTNFIARKKIKSVLKSILKEQNLPQNHVKFINNNIDGIIKIGLKIAPDLLKKHDLPMYLKKINDIKKLVYSKGELNRKELSLSLLDLASSLQTDAKDYQPLLIDFILEVQKHLQ
ncbi:MAG: hypothetical protein VX777_01915 [Chlamydiota bacterium]|nr:hypothetical protein [Chlamydiota bacterium]